MSFFPENIIENKNWLFLEQIDEFGLKYEINEVGEDFDWEKAKELLGRELEIGSELNNDEIFILDEITYTERSEW